MLTRFQTEVAAQADYVTHLRRELHKTPEPGFELERTAARVEQELHAAGLDSVRRIAGTGFVAELRTLREGPCVAVRADMDALPVAEETDLEYRSQHPGFSHCCGHDGHMASVLGLARILPRFRDRLCGRVRFLFQPAEETVNGALRMINEGALADPVPDAILALHAWPEMEAGTVACRGGAMMASTDAFRVRITGQGGHSARPERARNPVVGMARVVDALTALTGEERVVTLCRAAAGTAYNVIPDTASLEGTCRALTADDRRKLQHAVVETARAAAFPFEQEVDVTFCNGCPPVHVDPALYDVFLSVAEALADRVRFVELPGPSMGSEDFAFYLEHVPGLIFRVGMGLESPQLHRASFDYNDEALAPGMLVLGSMVLDLCAL